MSNHRVKRDSIISEAQASILWGEPPGSVRSTLVSAGLEATEADALLKEWESERDAAVRGIGRRKAFAGALLLLGAGVCVFLGTVAAADTVDLFRGRAAGGSIALALILGSLGLWRFVAGIILLVWPQSERRGIGELSE